VEERDSLEGYFSLIGSHFAYLRVVVKTGCKSVNMHRFRNSLYGSFLNIIILEQHSCYS